MSRIGDYFRDTQAEMQHVSWPTRQQTLVYTVLVVAIAGLVALFASGFDLAFSKLLDFVISNV